MPPFLSSPFWDLKQQMPTNPVKMSMYEQVFCYCFFFFVFCLVKTKTNLYSTCRNILTLTNNLEIPDKDITLENYHEWIKNLNITYPDEIANLKTCDLETFLSEVLLERSIISLTQIYF